jgi:hypothetical protein
VQAVVVLQVPEEPVLLAERAPAPATPVRPVHCGAGPAPVVAAHVAVLSDAAMTPRLLPNVLALLVSCLMPVLPVAHVAALAVMAVCARDTRCRQQQAGRQSQGPDPRSHVVPPRSVAAKFDGAWLCVFRSAVIRVLGQLAQHRVRSARDR